MNAMGRKGKFKGKVKGKGKGKSGKGGNQLDGSGEAMPSYALADEGCFVCGDKTHNARYCPMSPVNKGRAPRFGTQQTQNRAGCITLCSVTEVSNRYGGLMTDGEEDDMPPLTDSASEGEKPIHTG